MNNIRYNSGCWDCKNHLLHRQQDELDRWFCNINKDLPLYNGIDNNLYDGIVLDCDHFSKEVEAEIEKRSTAWNAWYDKHKVECYCICDDWNKE